MPVKSRPNLNERKSMSADNREIAKGIVAAIKRDLEDRKGIDNVFDEMDEEDLAEMEEGWVDEAVKVLDARTLTRTA